MFELHIGFWALLLVAVMSIAYLISLPVALTREIIAMRESDEILEPGEKYRFHCELFTKHLFAVMALVVGILGRWLVDWWINGRDSPDPNTGRWEVVAVMLLVVGLLWFRTTSRQDRNYRGALHMAIWTAIAALSILVLGYAMSVLLIVEILAGTGVSFMFINMVAGLDSVQTDDESVVRIRDQIVAAIKAFWADVNERNQAIKVIAAVMALGDGLILLPGIPNAVFWVFFAAFIGAIAWTWKFHTNVVRFGVPGGFVIGALAGWALAPSYPIGAAVLFLALFALVIFMGVREGRSISAPRNNR